VLQVKKNKFKGEGMSQMHQIRFPASVRPSVRLLDGNWHAVSTSLRLVDRVKTQTDERTDRNRESNLVHLWHLVAIILMNFLII